MAIDNNIEGSQLKRRRVEAPSFASRLSEVTAKDKNAFQHEVALWLGREVEEIEYAEKFLESLSLFLEGIKSRQIVVDGRLKAIKSDLKILKNRLKCLPEELKRDCSKLADEVKQILHLLKKPALLPHFLSVLIHPTRSQIEYLWNANYIESLPVAENDNQRRLHFSEVIREKIDDQTLELILKYSDHATLNRITYFDFLQCPSLSTKAPLIVAKACPKLDRGCLKAALESPRFQDHELKAEDKTISINKELMAFLIPFLHKVWESGMKEANAVSTQFPEAEHQALQRCVNAAYGTYDLENEQDINRLFATLLQADMWEQKDLTQRCGRRIVALLQASDELAGEKGYEILAQIYKELVPFFEQNQFTDLKEPLKKLGSKLIEKDADVALSMAQVLHAISQERPHVIPIELDETEGRFSSLIAALKNAIQLKSKYGEILIDNTIANECVQAIRAKAFHGYPPIYPETIAKTIEALLTFAPANDVAHYAMSLLHRINWHGKESDSQLEMLSLDDAHRYNPANLQVFFALVKLLRSQEVDNPDYSLKLLDLLSTENEKSLANPYHAIHLAEMITKGIPRLLEPNRLDALVVLDNRLKRYELVLERQPNLAADYEKVLAYKLLLLMQEPNKAQLEKNAILGLELVAKFRGALLIDLSENRCASSDPFTHVCIIAFFKQLANLGLEKLQPLIDAEKKANPESKLQETYTEYVQYLPIGDADFNRAMYHWTGLAANLNEGMIQEIFQGAMNKV